MREEEDEDPKHHRGAEGLPLMSSQLMQSPSADDTDGEHDDGDDGMINGSIKDADTNKADEDDRNICCEHTAGVNDDNDDDDDKRVRQRLLPPSCRTVM